jgi:hypothetical protein
MVVRKHVVFYSTESLVELAETEREL